MILRFRRRLGRCSAVNDLTDIAAEILPRLAVVRSYYGVRCVAAVLDDSGLIIVQVLPDGGYIEL